MTADGPGEDQTAPDGASWLHRLYRFETGVARDGPPPGDSGQSDRHVPRAAGSAPQSPVDQSRYADPQPSEIGRTQPTTESDSTASPLLRAIRREADFTDVRVVGSPTVHPYGRTARAAVDSDVERLRVSLRLFRRPEADQGGFASALATQLERWADASGALGIVPVLDRATSPRPWACTAPLGPRLREIEPGSIASALRDARDLAGALGTLHDRGIVHAGLDPDTVVFHTDPDSGAARPRLDVPGLLDVYRRYADPATILDPRFAPPEFYDADRGVLDRTTDVYGFGAVLFTLLTGRPPYDGDPATLRDAILSDWVPVPSSVAPRVPEAVDDLVVRAMQPAKFDRFETAEALLAAVEEVCRRFLEAEYRHPLSTTRPREWRGPE
ncbi:MAG: hypothetical protein V5A43_07090 [Haloarculaceae archaeon]